MILHSKGHRHFCLLLTRSYLCVNIVRLSASDEALGVEKQSNFKVFEQKNMCKISNKTMFLLCELSALLYLVRGWPPQKQNPWKIC